MTALRGIVLAAGASRRMGSPKPLLSAGAESFIEHAVRTLLAGGCAGVVAVVRPDDASAADLARAAGASVASGAPDGEQVDSLRIGLAAVPAGTEAVLVLPVDHPGAGPESARRVVDAWRAGGAPIVRPVYDGVAGHPTLFHRSLFDELASGGLPEGARTVIERHREEVEDVAVSEPGVVQDVNTPEDYREVRG